MKVSEIIGVIIVIIALLVAFAYTSQSFVTGPAPGNNPPAGNSSPPPADNPSPTSATNNASSPSVAPASTVSAPSSSSANSSNGISPPGLPYRTFHPDPCQMRINEKCVNYLGNGFWMIDGRLYDEVK